MHPISYAQLANEVIPYQSLGSVRCASDDENHEDRQPTDVHRRPDNAAAPRIDTKPPDLDVVHNFFAGGPVL